jgi:hypothetical protein
LYKKLEAALTTAQAYLLTTWPEHGDPREHMHQAAIQSLGLIEDKIMGNVERQSRQATRKGERRSSSAKPCKTSLANYQKKKDNKRGRRTQEI